MNERDIEAQFAAIRFSKKDTILLSFLPGCFLGLVAALMLPAEHPSTAVVAGTLVAFGTIFVNAEVATPRAAAFFGKEMED